MIENLVVYPEKMLRNLNATRGLVHSQRVLLALTQAGLGREDAYRLVQRNAMKSWEEGADFLATLEGFLECAGKAGKLYHEIEILDPRRKVERIHARLQR